MNQDEQKLADLIAVTASKSDAAHWPEAVAIDMGPIILAAKAEALREAATALENQPPKLRAQYVATLRLYADEPRRLTT